MKFEVVTACGITYGARCRVFLIDIPKLRWNLFYLEARRLCFPNRGTSARKYTASDGRRSYTCFCMLFGVNCVKNTQSRDHIRCLSLCLNSKIAGCILMKLCRIEYCIRMEATQKLAISVCCSW